MIETVDDIKTIANVGTGTMGHAITLQFALSGYPVHLVGRGEASLEKAMKAIRSDAEDFAEAGLLKDGDTLDAVLARITGYADYASGVADVDFVIESVAENLDIKKSVWAEVEHAAPKDAILSTNTSGLSPTALQSVLKKPERFVVAHFWNPAQLMPLVEVVPGEKTDPKVVDITFDLMAKIGKKPAKIKKESLGFVGNRLQLAVLREAFYIVQQGIADAATVDDVMKYSLGRRWNLVGPLASIDLGGLDVFYNISTYLFDDMDNGTGPSPLLAEKVREGNLGAKTGQGFFSWQGEDGKRIIESRNKALLRERYPHAKILGVDSSPVMIETARKTYPDIDFQLCDVSARLDELPADFDVVFSNACIQWVPDHPHLIPGLLARLRVGECWLCRRR